jgi:hypothetical protein
MYFSTGLRTKSQSVILPIAASQGTLGKYLAVSAAIVLGLVYLNIPVYAYTLNSALLPKYFYYALFLALGPFLILRNKQFVSYLVSPFSLWVVAVVLFNTIHLLGALAGQDDRTSSVIDARIQILLMVFFLGFVFSITRTAAYERVFPVLAVLVPCLVLVDSHMPGLLYPISTAGTVPGRAAGTFINPTIASEVILLGALLACGVVTKRARLPLFLLAGAGVVMTFTRSAIIAWVLLYIYLLTRQILPKSVLIIALVALGIPASMGGLETYLSNRSDIAGGIDNIEARLNFFSSGDVRDDSAQERLAVLKSSWELFLENPVFGAGAAVTEVRSTHWPHGVGPHNQFMVLAAEYGLIGISFWVFMAIILWRGRYFQDEAIQRAVFFLFLYMTMFTHNMLDAPYWLTTFALASGRRRI